VKYLADQHNWPLLYSRFFRGFLAAFGEWPKKHETAFFWSRRYGMTNKVKHRQLRVF
jgi:hypothetical protein